MATHDNQSRRALSDRLDKAQSCLSLALTKSQQDALINYLLELDKWNQTYNLTAVKSVDDMLVQHVFDCLAILPSLASYEKKEGLTIRLIADVGSGAGLPALVLAIFRPDVRVVSIDSVQKKTSFVHSVASKLGLLNLEARHQRVEAITDIKADLVISRAFASLKNFVDLAGDIATDVGVIAAMKAKRLEVEIREFNQDRSSWHVHQVDEICVPEMSANRYLAWLRRKNHD